MTRVKSKSIFGNLGEMQEVFEVWNFIHGLAWPLRIGWIGQVVLFS